MRFRRASASVDRMTSGRIRRVDEAVRAVLGDAISKDLQDPRVGFVTVTQVKTSPDLRHARVYVSVLGDDQARAETLDGLRSAHGYLQSRVAAELRLKHTPTLTFQYDDSVDRGMRISELIETLVGDRDEEDGDRTGTDRQPAGDGDAD
jgi:ribosome-binding factor A